MAFRKEDSDASVIRVRALETGSYPEFDVIHTGSGDIITKDLNWVRRREGDVFDLIPYEIPVTKMTVIKTRDGEINIPKPATDRSGTPMRRMNTEEERFSSRWMVRVPSDTPLSKTGGQENLNKAVDLLTKTVGA